MGFRPISSRIRQTCVQKFVACSTGPGPVVCDVQMILDEVRMPRLASAQLPDGSFVSKPLEDLWPFLDREEFEANMIEIPNSLAEVGAHS